MTKNSLKTLQFTRPMNLLGLLAPEETNRDTYLLTVNQCRDELEKKFASSLDDISKAITSDKDTGLTYCGMVKFLESEMEMSDELVGLPLRAKRKVIKAKARKMMQRSEAFTLAIRKMYLYDVRLSMHPSTGTAKLSFPLIPTADGNFQKSPWHSCVVVGADGSFRCVHACEVRHTHDLIIRDGRPWCDVERMAFTQSYS